LICVDVDGKRIRRIRKRTTKVELLVEQTVGKFVSALDSKLPHYNATEA
jgi:hypothetical protein